MSNDRTAQIAALRRMQGKQQSFDDGGTVQPETPETDNAPVGLLAAAPRATQTATIAPATEIATPRSGGGGSGIGGDHPLNQFTPSPQVPPINVVSNAYSPQLRGLPTAQSRQQASQQALQGFIDALARLKSGA